MVEVKSLFDPLHLLEDCGMDGFVTLFGILCVDFHVGIFPVLRRFRDFVLCP